MTQSMAPLRAVIAKAPRFFVAGATSREIFDFIEERPGSERVLHALYDDVLEEPVPGRLVRLVQWFRRRSLAMAATGG